ncbi:uncharacterized protein RHO25_008217 [Cercospora beticola]|uniref:FAD dependent oxidoreductase domain-containing protein n=1 Tax=Cercospora beticola TaxID=122368 RepID=A0ABZ0NVH0_CERBT|nr:hypothetical protein RHO25_008217 [Cercospora beticola]CAK1357680.1 unnamed protein product [Cercospora beticola]
MNARVIVVGAGWYGCHIAIELARTGYGVTLIEKESRILSRCSGTFGIRLHRGPHYPRSPATRRECRRTFQRFLDEYPELVVWHAESIYAYGLEDAKGHQSKVSLEDFEQVCLETPEARQLNPNQMPRFRDISAAYELSEPSIAIGEKLRSTLSAKLAQFSVELIINADIQRIDERKGHALVTWQCRDCNIFMTRSADFAIDATGYQAFPEHETIKRTLGLSIVYQACVAFEYRDKSPGSRPISFIVMDGWYPCLMPHIGDNKDGEDEIFNRYILTHGCYTILGTHESPQKAQADVENVESTSAINELKAAAEAEMCRFWPDFAHRFVYEGWKGQVLAKPRVETDFRSSLTFANGRVVHVVPGKISNVFNAADETLQLLEFATQGHGDVVSVDAGIAVVNSSSLITEKAELQKPSDKMSARATYNLQTLHEMR